MDNESVNSDYTESVTSSAFYNIFENLNDTEFSDIIETIEELFLIYIDDNSINMKDYKFVDTCTNTISNELYITWMDTNICTENNYDEIYHLVNSQINTLLIKYNIVPYVSEYNNDNLNNKNEIRKILKIINKIPQPQQRSTEWYKIRNNLISASSMWKIFKSDTTKRNLIIEKTKPKAYNNIYAASMEWGNKYEPVSIMIYEYMYNTKIGEFGCIPHSEYPFIGASPDGINIKEDNNLYGRMLEIKNIVNRDITGIPKEDYWIQTQIQMETCDLNYCDFLETRFTEYTENEFYNDTISEYKGIILIFTKNISNNTDQSIYDINNVKPIYEYYPINKCIDYQDIQSWISEKRDKYMDDYILYTTNYWKLDEISCVLIKRNKRWFNYALPIIKDTYDSIIENRKKTNLVINIDSNDNHTIHNMPTNSKHINVIKTK
tara:strand:+ start:560 stop:1864 length:1305 start_codon:yes stop_codon:yes gene_type:complete